jgi:hypothetical protein
VAVVSRGCSGPSCRCLPARRCSSAFLGSLDETRTGSRPGRVRDLRGPWSRGPLPFPPRHSYQWAKTLRDQGDRPMRQQSPIGARRTGAKRSHRASRRSGAARTERRDLTTPAKRSRPRPNGISAAVDCPTFGVAHRRAPVLADQRWARCRRAQRMARRSERRRRRQPVR